jgi:hypothetical protein
MKTQSLAGLVPLLFTLSVFAGDLLDAPGPGYREMARPRSGGLKILPAVSKIPEISREPDFQEQEHPNAGKTAGSTPLPPILQGITLDKPIRLFGSPEQKPNPVFSDRSFPMVRP